MRATHAYTMNGRINIELVGQPEAVEAEISRLVHLLDAERRYAIMLWRIPASIPFEKVKLKDIQEYAQAAGSSQRMVAEIRDAGGRQLALGRPDPTEGEALEEVPWDGHVYTVPPSEVLTADDVSDIFIQYYRSGGAPAGVEQRAFQRKPD